MESILIYINKIVWSDKNSDDGESGLHYNRFRYYNSGIGRYLKADQIGIIKGLNHLYVYSQNNPIIKFDSLGLYCETMGCLPTGFNLTSSRERKDLTDWVLKGAYGFGYDWQTATFGGIHCRWKKEIEVIDTYKGC
ncbi:MAG: RHS repeat-associated core domain-containing protein [Desulfobacteraceae bacterium]|nr:RHS repeat-associated core domain-containing protein [Desulfobacteraceae bacterium]